MNESETRGQGETEPDMTPMIDAVFLLIIFFLCIDFRQLEAKLPAYLPKEHGVTSVASAPLEVLSLGIVCDAFGAAEKRRNAAPADQPNNTVLRGHSVHWQLGPLRFDDPAALERGLQSLAADPSRMVRDPDSGALSLMQVVIEPGPGTVYDDVATTVDMVRYAGFEQIEFGGASPRTR